jgi:hypothetical protein
MIEPVHAIVRHHYNVSAAWFDPDWLGRCPPSSRTATKSST